MATYLPRLLEEEIWGQEMSVYCTQCGAELEHYIEEYEDDFGRPLGADVHVETHMCEGITFSDVEDLREMNREKSSIISQLLEEIEQLKKKACKCTTKKWYNCGEMVTDK